MNLPISRIVLITLIACFSTVSMAQQRADVNFAFGGSTTNSANATDAFAEQDPGLRARLADIRGFGLDVIGITQQLEFAAQTLNDIDPEKDLFWLYAGVNNYLAGEQDPSVSPNELSLALERLYYDLGARRFVLPNLPAIGDLPLFFGQPEEVREALNLITIAHNRNLTDVISQFTQAHPDAYLIEVDVFSVFQAHKISSEFSEISIGCDMVLPADELALPGACTGFLYLDIVHPASEAWTPVAQWVADLLVDKEVERIISIGDSFSDLGSMSDTFERALGAPFPVPPFTEGRFTQTENVVQQAEAMLGVETVSRPFSQPLRATETFTESGKAAMGGSLFVPKQLSGDAAKLGDKVVLRFTTQTCKIKCKYRFDGKAAFNLKKCSHFVQGGDLITTQAVRVKLKPRVTNVTIDWLHY